MNKYFISTYTSPLGPITLVADDRALLGLWFEQQKHYLEGFQDIPMQESTNPIIMRTGKWLDRYFQHQQPNPQEIPVSPRGTEFQQVVWQVLQDIPYGKTTCYGLVTRQVADLRKMGYLSARAVASAISRNSISIIIPCHRVVAANGALTGYAGGLNKKIWLLHHEREIAQETA